MGVDAVIFDWGGTLTPWMSMDGRAWWRIAEELARTGVIDPGQVEDYAARLHLAEEEVWRRSREEHRSGSLEEVMATVGLSADAAFEAIHDAEYAWATYLDPDAPEVLAALRDRGIRIGVLSNTSWSRAQHERIFARDGIAHLLDAAVYTSEIDWTKPHPEAFRAAMAAVGVTDPARCVMVGDRLFDDIFGAQQAGMRTVLLPHSVIPDVQRGHTDGEPDAVIQRLTDLVVVVDSWM